MDKLFPVIMIEIINNHLDKKYIENQSITFDIYHTG